MPTVRLSSHARRSYKKLHRSDRRMFERLDSSLERLRIQPELGKPLVGPLEGHRSLRVGHLRIIYRIERRRDEIQILDIASRAGVYRDLA